MDTNELKRKLRRDRDVLAIVGLGVMAFGIWSVLRSIMVFIIRLPELRAEIAGTERETVSLIIVGVFYLLIILAELRLRLYIGRSARAEGLRGERRTGYLFAAGFLVFFSLLLIVGMLFFFFSSSEIAAAARDAGSIEITSFIVELTSLATLLDMIAASVRVKRMTRELEERQG